MNGTRGVSVCMVNHSLRSLFLFAKSCRKRARWEPVSVSFQILHLQQTRPFPDLGFTLLKGIRPGVCHPGSSSSPALSVKLRITLLSLRISIIARSYFCGITKHSDRVGTTMRGLGKGFRLRCLNALRPILLIELFFVLCEWLRWRNLKKE